MQKRQRKSQKKIWEHDVLLHEWNVETGNIEHFATKIQRRVFTMME